VKKRRGRRRQRRRKKKKRRKNKKNKKKKKTNKNKNKKNEKKNKKKNKNNEKNNKNKKKKKTNKNKNKKKKKKMEHLKHTLLFPRPVDPWGSWPQQLCDMKLEHIFMKGPAPQAEHDTIHDALLLSPPTNIKLTFHSHNAPILP